MQTLRGQVPTIPLDPDNTMVSYDIALLLTCAHPTETVEIALCPAAPTPPQITFVLYCTSV